MNENLIQQERTQGGLGEKVFEYEGSPNPDSHIESLGLSSEAIPDDLSREQILSITSLQAEGLTMQDLADKGDFDALIPLIEDCLHAASADQSEFDRLNAFKSRAKSESNSSILAGSKLAFDAWQMKNKVDSETNRIPAGQLNYSTAVPGVDVQPTLI